MKSEKIIFSKISSCLSEQVNYITIFLLQSMRLFRTERYYLFRVHIIVQLFHFYFVDLSQAANILTLVSWSLTSKFSSPHKLIFGGPQKSEVQTKKCTLRDNIKKSIGATVVSSEQYRGKRYPVVTAENGYCVKLIHVNSETNYMSDTKAVLEPFFEYNVAHM